MHILLLILKIIGIILLVILGIFLLLLFCILFMPIRYQVKGEYQDKKIVASGKITYLFPIFMVIAGYDQEAYAKLKVFGFTLVDFLHPKEKKEKIRKERKHKKEKKEKLADDLIDDNEIEKKDDVIDDKQIEKKDDVNDDNQNEKKDDSVDVNDVDLIESNETKRTLKEKIQIVIQKIVDIYHKVIDFLENLDTKMETISKKLNRFERKVDWFLDFIEREDTLIAFNTAKKTILRLLKSIRPRKAKVYIHIGMDDPATTGQICAIYGVLYPFVEKCVMIEPDFEQTILEGDFFFKGYITGFMFVRVLCVVLFSRDLKCIRKLYKSRKRVKSE